MSNLVKSLNSKEFKSEVLEYPGLVLVDFWAPWCGPCRMVAPVLEEIAEEMKGQVKVTKVNVDDNGDLAGQYGVRGIPTFILFKAGELVAKNVGAAPKHSIEALIKEHL